MYLLLCLLGVMETRRQLVFWAENVFVLRKMNSYEKKKRQVHHGGLTLICYHCAFKQCVWRFLFCFPITVVCHQIRYWQRCSTHKKKEQKHNIMSPVLLQCACVSAGLWGAVSERDSVNTKCFLSKCWRICLCWSCSVCARTDVPG